MLSLRSELFICSMPTFETASNEAKMKAAMEKLPLQTKSRSKPLEPTPSHNFHAWNF